MQITIQLEAQLREIASAAELQLDVPTEATVKQAMQAVVAEKPVLADRLFAGDEITKSLMIFVNDQSVATSEADQRQLKAGESILLLPPISGG